MPDSRKIEQAIKKSINEQIDEIGNPKLHEQTLELCTRVVLAALENYHNQLVEEVQTGIGFVKVTRLD